MQMAWITLIFAGLFEVAWALGMGYTDGFKKPLPTVLTVIALIVSFVLLERAQRDIPIGTAYAVWVAIGVVGAAVVSALFLGDQFTWLRAFFLAMLIAAIIGLKMTTPAA